MTYHPDAECTQIETMGKKFETLALVDRLMEENEALKRELNLKTKRLRTLQKSVHAFLMGSEDVEGDKAKLIEQARSNHDEL